MTSNAKKSTEFDVTGDGQDCLSESDKQKAAEEIYRRWSNREVGIGGKDELPLFEKLNSLANLYVYQGRQAEAGEIYHRLLSAAKEALGSEHQLTLDTLNNLGNLYTYQGRFIEAGKMYEQALSGYRHTLQPEHPSVLDTMNNMANLYASEGRLLTAEKLYYEVFAKKKKVLGPSHLSTIDTMNNLGNLYVHRGLYYKGEKMHIETISAYTKILGLEHPSTLDTMNNLANLYLEQEKFAEAEEMFNRSLAGKEKSLGRDHPSTLETLNNLGNLCFRREDLEQAQGIYTRVLTARELSAGKEHISTLNVVSNLGCVYRHQGYLDQAEELFLRALEGRESTQGLDDISTIRTVENLALLYTDQGRTNQAVHMYLRSLIGKAKLLGPEDPMTLATLSDLENLIFNLEGIHVTEKVYVAALHDFQKSIGTDNPFSERARRIILSLRFRDDHSGISPTGSLDHLPLIMQPSYPPIEIEYIDDIAPPVVIYDNKGFANFPLRAGWEIETLLDFEIDRASNKSERSVAAFIQQWLFFGLLSAATGHKYTMDNLLAVFTRVSPSLKRRIITTRHLEKYLVQWRDSIPTKELQNDSETLKGLEAILDEARRALGKMSDSVQGGYNHLLANYSTISLSILVLGVVFTEAKCRIWPGSRTIRWPQSVLILSKMKEHGWCPSDIHMLQESLTPVGMYFASLCQPRMAQHDHTRSKCDRNVCYCMNINDTADNAFVPTHTADCDGQCALEDTHHSLLKALTGEDTLPVVSLEENTDGKFSLVMSALKLGQDQNYIAISHVWMEGLGNPRQNALPTCQLRRIQDFVTAASHGQTKYFWIDTLCVPQDSFNPKSQPSRIRAMCDMEVVYRSSLAVLVLDPQLLSISQGAAPEEQLVRIVCCSWMRRLWTLQEAVTGSKILLQFSDGVFDMIEGFKDFKTSTKLSAMSEITALTGLISSSIRQVEDLKRFRRDRKSGHLFPAVWNACRTRTNSKAQDEAFCLAVMLGLDTLPILAAPNNEKWKRLLLLQKYFPIDLLFSPVPRLSEPGYRWAPLPFSWYKGTKVYLKRNSTALGEASDKGLSFTAPGMVLAPLQTPLRTEPITSSMILMLRGDKQSQTWYRIKHRTEPNYDQAQWEDFRNTLHRDAKLGLIFDQDIDEISFNSAHGVLVALEQDTLGDGNDLFQGAFLACVRVYPEPRFNSTLLDRWLQEGTLEEETHYRTAVGTRLLSSQKWCVR
ncbi:hypothetical protein PV08_08315 [Exophiala spinifera]|uniref:Heterokaryon incompatibility domain-containing protein n=1 Tax=Exophiala spinifera TaxID=91928 RepID=A0A0D2B2I8_9EURO|nr:uncharacterized protein PV08_08315 [Exophiala spinifera]KIW13128.1 hypothetical protein PV08_08315 [Exophiala spinifera]